MAYTTQAKIESMFRNIDIQASGTIVTNDEVTEFISRADAMIDSKLDRYYVTPITGTKSLLVIEEISTLLVAHRIKTILEVTSQDSDRVQEVQTNLEKKAMKMLEALIPVFNKTTKQFDVPIMDLIDATKRDFSPDAVGLFKTHATTDTTIKPTFTKGGTNW